MFQIDPIEEKRREAEAFSALMQAWGKHVKVVQHVAGFTALSIDKENVYMGTFGATLQMKTALFVNNEDVKKNGIVSAWIYKMEFSQETMDKFDDLGIEAAKFGPATADDLENAEANRDDGQDVGPISFDVQMIPVTAPNGKNVPMGEVLAWLHINDVREEGGDAAAEEAFRLFYRKPDEEERKKQRRKRKPELIGDQVVMSTTKVEKAIFGEEFDGDRITADRYDGSITPINLKGLGTVDLALRLDSPVDKMTAAELADAQLSSIERFWLTALQSCVEDNPEKTRFYGSDLMKRRGYKKPLRPDHAETMIEAADAIAELTHMSMWLDTTEEALRYERDGRVVTRITDQRIVNGMVSLEQYTDGTRDFFVDLYPVVGGPVSSALPLFEYAKQKRELITADHDVFDFTGCGPVTAEHRRIMDSIYRQLKSRGLGNNFTISALLKKNDIEDTKDTRYRICKKLTKLLDWWKEKGVIKDWEWTYKGRARHGLKIVPMPDEDKKTKRQKVRSRDIEGTKPRY